MEKHSKELLGFFGTAIGIIFALLVILFIFSIFIPVAYGAEGVSNAEFYGIMFKTRYQNTVRITTPVLVQMGNETRVLNIAIKDPASAKFSFLFKITPGDYQSWADKVKDNRGAAMFTWSGSARFIQGPKTIRIDLITLVIDTGPNRWLDDHKSLIENNFKNCKMISDQKGDPDMVCPPLWVTARITKIGRSTLSPDLPQSHVFPHLDYIDIYIEVLSVSMARPKK